MKSCEDEIKEKDNNIFELNNQLKSANEQNIKDVNYFII